MYLDEMEQELDGVDVRSTGQDDGVKAVSPSPSLFPAPLL